MLTVGDTERTHGPGGAGDYDAFLNAWADRLKAFVSGPDGSLGTADDRRVYIRLAHEMNGNWYPWSAVVGGNSAALVSAMWQRACAAIFSPKGSTATVQWIWARNNEHAGSAHAESYYPGDAYVDWVGVDGYNWGVEPELVVVGDAGQVFAPMVRACMRSPPSRWRSPRPPRRRCRHRAGPRGGQVAMDHASCSATRRARPPARG